MNAPESAPTQVQMCNCRVKEVCPLEGKCLDTNSVYKATVTSDQVVKYYYGPSEGQFNFRYKNHKKSFKNQNYENDTELSKYIWELKGQK